MYLQVNRITITIMKHFFFKGRGQIGELNKGKRDKMEVIGGWKGQCVINFFAECGITSRDDEIPSFQG